MLLRVIYFSCLLLPSFGCFANGDEKASAAEGSKRMLELRRKNPDSILNDQFVQVYLQTFGYIKPSGTETPQDAVKSEKQRLQDGITAFQHFMGIPASGKVDGPTSVMMMRKRCGNEDMRDPKEPVSVWEKNSLTWNITRFPHTLSEKDVRETLHQAFTAWEVVLPMDFVETDDAEKADLVFTFEEPEGLNDPTHLSIARASGPFSNRVWISSEETFTQGGTDLFNVFVHEIGHLLGLQHSRDPNSMMHPVFERDESQLRPQVTSDDVERIRNMYQVVDLDTGVKTVQDAQGPPKCPNSLDSVTVADDGRLLLFRGDRVWQAVNRSIIAPSTEIFQLFPSGPTYVNASATIGKLTVLLSDREIHGYQLEQSETEGEEEEEKFVVAEGFPKTLHSRVLFYPEAAFPLANGSLILLKDDVFATYDLEANAPTMLNDKRVFFPNLPDALRSGVPLVPGSDEAYFMFTENKVHEYDTRSQQIVNTFPLATFLTCDF